MSAGAASYYLQALVEKGWIQLKNLQKNPNKLCYLHLLAPMVVATKVQCTCSFLRRKMPEYDARRAETVELGA